MGGYLLQGGYGWNSRVLGPACDPVLRRLLPVVARRLFHSNEQAASDLLVHCADEMRHLAGFLPALHAEFAIAGAA